ncbi:MAG TPA: fasciclin domain-containing protein [Candidatus Eremiobacteraeota bacterium]|nr:MAG: Immunogenic protein MPT70 precursor [bacterium ADurb.Bin363]HPZ10332.1 fasciclin domain-containing protein [Candidatus Eremiobacteraeota bacterium]
MKNHKSLTIILIVYLIAIATAGYIYGAGEKKDIVDTAKASDSFKTLVKALESAGLVDTLKSKGPFTVFAPTDEAFAKLPKGTLQDLLKPENKNKLKSILTYHVVSGEVFAKDVVKLYKAKSLQGQKITVKVKNKVVMVDNAKVVKTDIKASNGVIHVIDTVIMPPPKAIEPDCGG